MDMSFAYKIMRARQPCAPPSGSATQTSFSSRTSPSRLRGLMTSAFGEASQVDSRQPACGDQPCGAKQQSGAPRRSVSAVALCSPANPPEASAASDAAAGAEGTAEVDDSKRSISPTSISGAASQAASPLPAGSRRATGSATGEGGDLPLHLVPRSQVPSARGVTIGPFAEAIDAAASSGTKAGAKSSWRRQAAGALLRPSPKRRTTAPPLVLLAPDPSSPSFSSGGSPQAGHSAAALTPSPPGRRSESLSYGGTSSAAAARSFPQRQRRGSGASTGLQPTPPASPPPQMLLPRVGSQRARQASLTNGTTNGSSRPDTPPEDQVQPHSGSRAARLTQGLQGRSSAGEGLRSAASTTSLAAYAGGSSSGGGSGSAAGGIDPRVMDGSASADLEGWLDSPASASSPSAPLLGVTCRVSITAAGGRRGSGGHGVSSSTGGAGRATVAGARAGLGLARTTSGSGSGLVSGSAVRVSESELRPAGDAHGDPSPALLGGDGEGGHTDAAPAPAAAGGAGLAVDPVAGGGGVKGTASAASKLFVAAGLVPAAKSPFLSAESPRCFLPALPTSLSGEALAQGPDPLGPSSGPGSGPDGGGGGVARVQFKQPLSNHKVQQAHHQHHQQQQQQVVRRLKASVSDKNFSSSLPTGPGASGGSVSLLRGGGGGGVYGMYGWDDGGDDLEADTAELASLEQWAAAAAGGGGAAGGALQPQQLQSMMALSATVEQRRALRRLEYLRARVLRARASVGSSGEGGGGGGGGGWSPCASPEPGPVPSWAADIAQSGRRGSDSLAALASQVSRLPHIDYDQMRDPQYRMLLKLRSRQAKAPQPAPANKDEPEDAMPIPGRRRPWKPIHI